MKPVRILIVILLYSFTVVVYCQAQVEPSFKKKAGETSMLLQAALEKGEAILWHLYHSGFAVKSARHLLIFDYWPEQKVLKNKKRLAAPFFSRCRLQVQVGSVFIIRLNYWKINGEIDKISKNGYISTWRYRKI
ncbi:MAG: hypothetical protein JSV88_09390 [Candidatus Aminicenantes bacterium]|nr:MAG: hypothetical protein JSV88_09390 [Candidatus Aminicenantes bacterium]